MSGRIKLDVYGQMYTVPSDIIENGPSSRLKRMYKAGLSMSSRSENMVIDRPPNCFAAILAFYQTGELHIPMTLCPGAFMNELEYWEISPERLSDCCYNKLQSFLDEQDTLRKFKHRRQRSNVPSNRCFDRIRARVWETVDYTKPSFLGKIYFIVTVFMVLSSISILAYSTDPSFQREMTNCERLEYMSLSRMSGYDDVKPHLEQFCSDNHLPYNSSKSSKRINSTGNFMLLDRENGNEENDFLFYIFSFFHEILREMNNSESAFESLDPFDRMHSQPRTEPILSANPSGFNDSVFGNGTEFGEENLPNNGFQAENLTFTRNENHTLDIPNLKLIPPPLIDLFEEIQYVKVPNLKIKLFILVIFESLTTIYFTIDFILRLSSCPSIKHYFLSVINFTDGLSLLSAYLYFCLYYMYPQLRYGSWIDYFSYMQMLRSLRLFRIASNVRAGRVLAYSARKNIKDISVLIFFLIVGMCTFATFFYVAENKTTVESIPDAWYWALITMTTVGYGDIQPKTKAGRLIACICAVSGVLLLALTVPIFANHFLILYQHVEAENVVEKIQIKRRSARETVKVIAENNKDKGISTEKCQ